MASQNSDVCQHASGNREDIARRGTLTQFHQRVAIGQTRIYKDKQYIQRIKDFSSMMLSRHRRIILLLTRSSKRSTRSKSESTNYLKKKQFRGDLREAQKACIHLTQLERVHTKASSKIQRLGRLVSQKRMPPGNREASLTLIDEKPTDGTSTSKKAQDEHQR